jgi:hypothetical protein
MLERSKGLADQTKHHVQEIQGISPTHLWSLYPISQLSLNIPPIWNPITVEDVITLQLCPV